MTTLEKCPTCGKSKSSSTSASITQWVSVCRCDGLVPNDELIKSVRICMDCKKRINPGRHGSLTQWIFHSDYCKCEHPSPGTVDDGIVPVLREQFTIEKTTDEDEIEIPFDKDSFPLERYKPIGIIGEGSSGNVYLCRDHLLQKKVAVKVLKSITPEQMITFQNEAKTTARLQHASIVKVLDFGATASNSPYMVMEYIQGHTLKQLISEYGPLDPQLAVLIFERIADALFYAHEQSIYHRDLQTGNLIIQVIDEDNFNVFVVDFGLAKVKQETLEPTIYDGKVIAGTPLYMSPDQVNGFAYDQRSEIYSLGCIMFEALTGSPPFMGNTALDTIRLHAQEAPPSLLDLMNERELAVPLDEIVYTCIAKKPDDRYQDMGELSKDLKALHSEFNVLESTDTTSGSQPTTNTTSGVRLVKAFSFLLILAVPLIYWVYQSVTKPEEDLYAEYNKSQITAYPQLKTLNAPVDNTPEKEYTEVLYVDPNMAPERLEKLLDNQSLEGVTIPDASTMSLSSLQSLSKLSNLKELSISSPSMPASDFGKLLSSIKNLEKFCLSNAAVDDADIGVIVKNNPNLSDLVINKCPIITSAGLKEIAKLKHLGRLDLRGIRLQADDFKTLPKNISMLAYSDYGLDRIKVLNALMPLKKLQDINVYADKRVYVEAKRNYTVINMGMGQISEEAKIFHVYKFGAKGPKY